MIVRYINVHLIIIIIIIISVEFSEYNITTVQPRQTYMYTTTVIDLIMYWNKVYFYHTCKDSISTAKKNLHSANN